MFSFNCLFVKIILGGGLFICVAFVYHFIFQQNIFENKLIHRILASRLNLFFAIYRFAVVKSFSG